MKYQLLVRNPQEKLEIVYVGDSGGYYDNERILWDERTNDPFPEEYRAELDAEEALKEQEKQDKKQKKDAAVTTIASFLAMDDQDIKLSDVIGVIRAMFDSKS